MRVREQRGLGPQVVVREIDLRHMGEPRQLSGRDVDAVADRERAVLDEQGLLPQQLVP